MTTLEITLDESTAEFVERQSRARGFGSPAEYIQFVLTEEKVSAERGRLEQQLLEGLDSGPSVVVDNEFWERFELEHFGKKLTKEDV